MGHWIEYIAFQFISALLGVLPLSRVRRIGAFLGETAYNVLGFRRPVTRENLRLAFPDATDTEIEAIARESFRNIATTLVELLYYPSLDEKDIRSTVEFGDDDVVVRLYEQGKGIILLTSHLGNWELLPIAVHLRTGIPVSSLYKPQSNLLIDRKIAERRIRFGTRIIPMGLSVRDVLRCLHDGEAVLMAADQSAPKESIRVNFFGRSTPVFQGPALFSLKTGAPLVLSHMVRTKDGGYRLQFLEIPSADLSNTEDGIRELTKRHVAATEEIIREAPEQWMWMHRRWKHATDRPGNHENS